MPRQRIQYDSETYGFPDDFPERLKRFQKESGLSWSEIARRPGTYRHTVWRWAEGRPGPTTLTGRRSWSWLAVWDSAAHMYVRAGWSLISANGLFQRREWRESALSMEEPVRCRDSAHTQPKNL